MDRDAYTRGREGTDMEEKLTQLDATMIADFIAWASDATSFEPMSQGAKDVLDALIERHNTLLAEEKRRKCEAKSFWIQDQDKQLPVRGQYYQHKNELRRLLAANPDMSVSDLARHFDKSKPMIADWLNKYRAGL